VFRIRAERRDRRAAARLFLLPSAPATHRSLSIMSLAASTRRMLTFFPVFPTPLA